MRIRYIGADKKVNNPIIGDIEKDEEREISEEQWEQIKSNVNFIKVSRKEKVKNDMQGGNE